jgi:hypothetical protein
VQRDVLEGCPNEHGRQPPQPGALQEIGEMASTLARMARLLPMAASAYAAQQFPTMQQYPNDQYYYSRT